MLSITLWVSPRKKFLVKKAAMKGTKPVHDQILSVHRTNSWKKPNLHRINAGKYITYMVSSYALMTPALISGGDVLAVLIDPKILRISAALSLSLRYLFRFFGIFSLYEFASGHTASA